jgi:hypothetical protein
MENVLNIVKVKRTRGMLPCSKFDLTAIGGFRKECLCEKGRAFREKVMIMIRHWNNAERCLKSFLVEVEVFLFLLLFCSFCFLLTAKTQLIYNLYFLNIRRMYSLECHVGETQL